MLLSTIIPLYALALVQATALKMDVSPRNIDVGCILEPNSTTIWSKKEGLAKLVRWNTDTACVNSTMPDSGSINLSLLTIIGPPIKKPDPDWTTPASDVSLRSGQATVQLAEDIPTGPFILALEWNVTNEDGTTSTDGHLSSEFAITK